MAENLDFRVKNGLVVTTTATVEGTTQATSTNTGALQVAGGAGIGQNLYVGGIFSATGDVYAASTVTLAGSTVNIAGDTRITALTQSTTTNTGALIVDGGVGIGKNLNVGGDTRIRSTTSATSATTGALVVDGGVGIVGDIWIGGTIYGSVLGATTTATNLFAGTAGQVPYQVAPGQTSFFGPGTAGQFLQSNGTSAPSYVSTADIYVGFAVTATNLNFGAQGSLPYQTAAGQTTFLPIGSPEELLSVNSAGTAIQWNNTTSFAVGRATTATNANNSQITNDTIGASVQYITYVTTTTGYTGIKTSGPSGLTFIPGSGNVGIGVATPASKLDVAGAARFTGVTTVTNTTQATSTATGAFQVKGGASFQGNVYVWNTLTVTDTSFSTSTLGGNAAYVAGGLAVGKSLYVKGPVLFEDNVTFAGTTTNVLSTNTFYTDNIIDVHFPSGPGAGPSGIWSVDDGKDIGFIFHNYKTADNHSALVWRNGSEELQWWKSGVEWINTGTYGYTGSTATLGTLRLGLLRVDATTASNSTSTGALTVGGGAGIAGDLYVGGTIYGNAAVSGSVTTATNLFGGAAGQIPYQVSSGLTNFFGPGSTGTVLTGNGDGIPTFVTTSSLYVGYAVTATNINSGTAGQLVYQTNTGTSGFVAAGTAGQILVSRGTTSTGPVFTNTGSIYIGYAANANNVEVTNDTASSTPQLITFVSTTSYTNVKTAFPNGLVYVPSTGNIGVGTATPSAKLDVNGGSFLRGVTTVTNTTQASSTQTGALVVAGGAGIGNSLYVGGGLSVNLDTTVGGDLAVNGGDLTSNATTFNLLDTTVTTLNFARAGTAITVGATSGYTTIRNLTTITNTTNSSNTATGALVVYGGAGIAGNLYVGGTISGTFSGSVTGTATTASNLANGTAGQLPYQTGPGATSFFGPGGQGQLIQTNGTSSPTFVGTGTAGQILVSRAATGPAFVDTSTIYVGYSVTATHLNAGAGGSIPYQSAAGQTTFLPIGTSSYILVSNGSTPIWSVQSGLGAGSADTIKVTNDVASTTTHYLSFVSTSSGYQSLKTAATTGMYYTPSTGNLGIGTAATIGTSTIAVQRSKLDIWGSGVIQFHQSWFNGGGVLDLLYQSSTWKFGSSSNEAMQFGANSPLTIAAGATNNYIGINTASPAAWLDVNGAAFLRGVSTVTNVTTSSNTTTGALQVRGGVGVGGNIYTSQRVGYVNTSNVSRVYTYYNAAQDSLDTVFE